MKIDSSVELKRAHAKEIINYLKKNKNTMRKNMAEELKLSFATVSNLCNEMKEKGYLKENALDDTKVVGRTPKGVSLDYRNLLALCFDMTQFGVLRACVIDYGNQIVFDQTFFYEKESKIEDVIRTCIKIYEEHILLQFEERQIIGVGAAVPGIFEKSSRNIVSSEIALFNNQPMKDMLSKALNKTVYMDNESNLCVMSQYMKRDKREEKNNLIYIFADDGLGIGVIANGQLIRGTEGYAPEICHIPIGNPKISCHLCGNFGCVESDLRRAGYLEKYVLMGGEKLENLEEFLRLVQNEDKIAEQVIEENGKILGQLLSILNNMFNPDCIYLGGNTLDAAKICLERGIQEVKSRMLVPETRVPDIELDDKSSTTVLIGTAEMIFSKWMPI